MSKISKEADRINLDHLSGDARKYVEYLISSKEIVDQDQVMILCEIMKEAQDESIVNAFSYVLEQSEKRMNLLINLNLVEMSGITIMGSDLIDLF